MDKPKPRRKYLYCSRCGTKKLFKVRDIDMDADLFLCGPCDDLYIKWQLKTGGIYVDTFLAHTRRVKKCA